MRAMPLGVAADAVLNGGALLRVELREWVGTNTGLAERGALRDGHGATV